ncbi:uncharacterized protein [Paramisgurnus dabryanus]|uniref:uncharacterized protein n=1 Tax=Paramisgurnus dabryanus TaxID=90735 RepID=UPI003CCF0A89
MLFIFGLMLVVLQTVSCEDQKCSFNPTTPCNAVLGEKISLQIIQDINFSSLQLKKDESLICKIQNYTQVKPSFYCNRIEFNISKDTVIINSVTRADSGRYTLELYDLEGKRIHYAELRVNVKDPYVTLIALSCVTVILIVLVITVYYIYKRKNHESTAEMNLPTDIQYATVIPQKKSDKGKTKEEEVQYGEVTFTPGVHNIQKPQKQPEECVYAETVTSAKK